MKKQRLLLVLLLVSIVVGIFAITATAIGTSDMPTLTITSNTLELKNAVYMNFKVSCTNVVEASDVKLLVWESAPDSYTADSAHTVLSSMRTEEDTGRLVFQFNDLAAKDMTKFIYVCAYANVNGTEVYSKPVKFGIL